MNNSNKNSKKSIQIIGVALFVVALVAMTYVLFNQEETKQATKTSSPYSTQNDSTKDSATTSVKPTSTEELLLYLIEEEKLAHDVYTVMYQKYGARVFGSILTSEESHQAQVLSLLKTRNIADPRSQNIGEFKNQELQALYDQLIEQGNKSEVDAFKAGVVIEEKDIADISAQLATATEQDIIDTLEALRRGSENHLRAFNRQL